VNEFDAAQLAPCGTAVDAGDVDGRAGFRLTVQSATSGSRAASHYALDL
jgi:hypothetical protein